MSKSLNIFPAGLNEQDKIVVNTAIKLLTFDQINYNLIDTPKDKAHLLILDEESAHGKQALKLSRPGQVKIIVSSRPAMAKNTIGLQRPVELGKLKALLTKIYSKLQSQLDEQTRRQITAKTNAPVETQSETLFKLLLDAKTRKDILHITSPELPDFFIDGRNHCLASAAGDTQIEKLLNLPLASLSITRMNPESFAVHSNELSIQSLHNLLWLAGIKCSQGKLLPGHKIDAPFRLRAWPNFTRNTFIAEHLKLAAALAKQAMDLTQLAELTQVRMPEVINFYNAAFAVDLIEYSDATELRPAATHRQSATKQGLFAKIAKRLNLKNIF